MSKSGTPVTHYYPQTKTDRTRVTTKHESETSGLRLLITLRIRVNRGVNLGSDSDGPDFYDPYLNITPAELEVT